MTANRFSLFLLFFFIIYFTNAQSLEQTKENIIGNWEIDVKKTREIYLSMQDHMTEQRIKEVEGMLNQVEVYNWLINADGTCTMTYKMKDSNSASEDSEWSLEMAEFKERELELIGVVPVFEPWINKKSWVSINVRNDGMYVLKCTNKELIIFDVGSPMAFMRSE